MSIYYIIEQKECVILRKNNLIRKKTNSNVGQKLSLNEIGICSMGALDYCRYTSMSVYFYIAQSVSCLAALVPSFLILKVSVKLASTLPRVSPSTHCQFAMNHGCQASSKSTLPTNRVPGGESIDVLFFDVGGYLYKKQ